MYSQNPLPATNGENGTLLLDPDQIVITGGTGDGDDSNSNDDELKDNAKIVAERLGDVDWMFSYQSAAETGEPWLGPPIEEVIVDLANQGYKHMLVAPIGFVCDHVEILYDIDIEAKQIAEEHGIHLERIESMNSTLLFIEAVTDAIVEKMEKIET